MANQLHLLGTRRFLPLFLVQFFGAFNDNVFKNAFVALVTFKLARERGWDPAFSAVVIAGVFILPFFLFSALAGQMADKYEKARLVRWTKVWELGAMLLAAAGFFWTQPAFLLFVLFLLGTQAAFFGPLKYGLLPYHLHEEELVGGNAIFEAATYVAILGGTILGGLLIMQPNGALLTSAVLLGMALLGWLASHGVPRAEAQAPALRISPNFLKSTLALLGYARTQRGVFRAILGISWFWLIGATWLMLIPAFVGIYLQGGEHEYTLLMTVFAVGIGVGSLLCNRLLHGEVSAKFVPLAGVGLSLCMLDFVLLCAGLPVADGQVAPILVSLDPLRLALSPTGWRIVADLAGIAVCGGIFSVPLYALMQAWSEPDHRARVIAANNVMNSLFMVAASLVQAGLFALGWTIPQVLLLLTGANLLVAVYVVRLVPESVIHTLVRGLLRLLYRVEVRGLDQLAAARARRIIIANHTSFLDALLLVAFLPTRLSFAIDTKFSSKGWMRLLYWAVDLHPLDPTKPMAIKTLTELARAGHTVVIFPEGRLTVTGTLMKVYEGPAVIADKADADLVPVQIQGAQYSTFSRLRGKARLRWFPRITLTILPPRSIHSDPHLHGRAARQQMARELYDVMARMAVATADLSRPLFSSLIDAAETHGRGWVVVEDARHRTLSYRKLLAAALFLGPKLVRGTQPGDAVGLMLPNSCAAVAAFFGLQAVHRVAAMINFSSGAANIVSTCHTAGVRRVWTSREFVELGKLQGVVAALVQAGVAVAYMEDCQRRSLGDHARLLVGLVAPRLSYGWHRRALAKTPASQLAGAQPAVVLFTSGSTGQPKAVVLSHRNLQANRAQLSVLVGFTRQDRFFNCLPIFHSFGLTGGTLVPVLAGVPVFMYPTPLHYGVIPELVYQTNSTVLFGTNTFLAGYARKAHPYDFHSLRYAFAGAEKLTDATRRSWSEQFGVRLFEGYGATETAPVLATNTPMYNRPGTVGRFLPGLAWRLEPVPGIATGGRLQVQGENVMLGYYLPENPGVLVPPAAGWYDTGDIVEVSEDGFVRIVGRAKRFAKIGGEMVSLAAVEELASRAWPGARHAALARPHPTKGEEVLLFTEQPDAVRTVLVTAAHGAGVPELCVPRQILVRHKLPVLGTGKPDYVTLTAELARLVRMEE